MLYLRKIFVHVTTAYKIVVQKRIIFLKQKLHIIRAYLAFRADQSYSAIKPQHAV